MKKSLRPTAALRPAGPVRRIRVAPRPFPSGRGVRSIHIARNTNGRDAIVIQLAPHHLVIITGGAKPTVSLACTHHGFVAEAYELNGQLEQVINHVRKRFPELRVD